MERRPSACLDCPPVKERPTKNRPGIVYIYIYIFTLNIDLLTDLAVVHDDEGGTRETDLCVHRLLIPPLKI